METDDIIKDLNELQKQIVEGKRKVAQLEGRKEEQLKRLKVEFDVSTIAEAQKLLVKKETLHGGMKKMILEKYKTLKEQFEW